MKDLYKCQVGLSDHTFGLGVRGGYCTWSNSHRKTLYLSRSDGGVDSAFSLEPDEMKQLVYETKNAWLSLGEIKYGPTNSEKSSTLYKRSIYVSEDISKGSKFNTKNIELLDR